MQDIKKNQRNTKDEGEEEMEDEGEVEDGKKDGRS